MATGTLTPQIKMFRHEGLPEFGIGKAQTEHFWNSLIRQMLLEGLHVDHLRLIVGTSMGCMQAFVWGEAYPGFSDALMPLACLPTELPPMKTPSEALPLIRFLAAGVVPPTTACPRCTST